MKNIYYIHMCHKMPLVMDCLDWLLYVTMQTIQRKLRVCLRRCLVYGSCSVPWTSRCWSLKGHSGCRRSDPGSTHGPRPNSAPEPCSDRPNCSAGSWYTKARCSGKRPALASKVVKTVAVYEEVWCDTCLCERERDTRAIVLADM